MALSTDRIPLYVPLLNEGTDVLRPTTGVFVVPDVVRVEATDDYDPDIEDWEFPPGTEVRCIADSKRSTSPRCSVAGVRVVPKFPILRNG